MERKLPSFNRFINESFESRGDLLKNMFDAVKKSGNSTIKSQLDYQNFDKEAFFDLYSNGINFRVHYDEEGDRIILTNMDNGDSTGVNSVDELLTQLN
jgi:hypothetical protein